MSLRLHQVNQPKDHAFIDAAPEERAITINTAHVEYETQTSLRSHRRSWHATMLKTWSPVPPGVILVVASTDGPRHKTREHILLSRQVGVKHLTPSAQSDLVDDKNCLMVEMEIRDLLSEYISRWWSPVVQGSALKALEGIPVNIAYHMDWWILLSTSQNQNAIPTNHCFFQSTYSITRSCL